jgi:hypothetical protein
MKSLSPWFQTARLINGIRKTVSEVEAERAAAGIEERRSGQADRDGQRPS